MWTTEDHEKQQQIEWQQQQNDHQQQNDREPQLQIERKPDSPDKELRRKRAGPKINGVKYNSHDNTNNKSEASSDNISKLSLDDIKTSDEEMKSRKICKARRRNLTPRHTQNILPTIKTDNDTITEVDEKVDTVRENDVNEETKSEAVDVLDLMKEIDLSQIQAALNLNTDRSERDYEFSKIKMVDDSSNEDSDTDEESHESQEFEMSGEEIIQELEIRLKESLEELKCCQESEKSFLVCMQETKTNHDDKISKLQEKKNLNDQRKLSIEKEARTLEASGQDMQKKIQEIEDKLKANREDKEKLDQEDKMLDLVKIDLNNDLREFTKKMKKLEKESAALLKQRNKCLSKISNLKQEVRSRKYKTEGNPIDAQSDKMIEYKRSPAPDNQSFVARPELLESVLECPVCRQIG